MKDIWMVIYSQVIKVAKAHLQLPPVQSETGAGARLAIPSVPGTCISKAEKKEKGALHWKPFSH